MDNKETTKKKTTKKKSVKTASEIPNNNLLSPQFLKQGSYGCVHRPPLQCEAPNEPNTPDKITKLLTKKDAQTELTEYNLISRVDPGNTFSLKTPKACKIAPSPRNYTAIKECEIGKKVLEALDDYRLLVMKNGGEDLDDYANKMAKMGPTPFVRQRIQYLWMEIHHMMMAIHTLLEHKIVHHDIKRENILYCEKTRRMYLIDFGLMELKNAAIGKCYDNDYGLDTQWWYYPFDSALLNKRIFNDVIFTTLMGSNDEKSDDRIRRFVQKNFVQVYQKDQEHAENWLFFLIKYTHLNPDEIMSLISDFTDFIVDVQTAEINYEKFVYQYFDTLDAYSLAVACIELLYKTRAHLPEDFYHQSRALFLQMMSFHPMQRPNIGTIVSSYENILESTGMLHVGSNRMVFKNHVLTPVSATAAGAAAGAAAAASTASKVFHRITQRELKTVSEMDPPSNKPKSVKSAIRQTKKTHDKAPKTA